MGPRRRFLKLVEREMAMSRSKAILLGVGAWLGVMTTLHLWLNVSWSTAFNDFLPEEQRKLNVAYIPVT